MATWSEHKFPPFPCTCIDNEFELQLLASAQVHARALLKQPLANCKCHKFIVWFSERHQRIYGAAMPSSAGFSLAGGAGTGAGPGAAAAVTVAAAAGAGASTCTTRWAYSSLSKPRSGC